MKIRLDFVTNSSSLSYVVGIRGELTKERLLKLMGVPEASLLYPLAEELAETIVRRAEEWTKRDILEEWGELWGIMPKILNSGMTCYIGFASSEGDMIEQVLCHMPIEYESEDLIIDAGGGY